MFEIPFYTVSGVLVSGCAVLCLLCCAIVCVCFAAGSQQALLDFVCIAARSMLWCSLACCTLAVYFPWVAHWHATRPTWAPANPNPIPTVLTSLRPCVVPCRPPPRCATSR